MALEDVDLERIVGLISSGVDRLEGLIKIIDSTGLSLYKYKAYRIIKTIRIDLIKSGEKE